jgi:hypothetical protein
MNGQPECLICNYPLTPSAIPELFWCKSCDYGRGRTPLNPYCYDTAYAKKYDEYAQTSLGSALTRARIGLLHTSILPGEVVVDYGCGSGQLVSLARKYFRCWGYEVNSAYQQYWRPQRNAKFTTSVAALPWNPAALVFADSLEHLETPTTVIRKFNARVLLIIIPAMPHEEWGASRHLRPGEHLHYFAVKGVERYLESLGYRVVLYTDVETRLGREHIYSWVAQRTDT